MPGRSATVRSGFVFALAALWMTSSLAQTTSPPSPEHLSAVQKLTVTVTDENGVAVASARVQLQPRPPAIPLRCQTDFAGRCEFPDVPSGAYDLRVEKSGFYAVVQPDVRLGITAN